MLNLSNINIWTKYNFFNIISIKNNQIPELILADEPTGNLDSNSSKQVIHTLSYINQEFGKTIVMVTHDPQMASYCSWLILLKDGVILEDLKNSGNQDAFYQEILGKMKEL